MFEGRPGALDTAIERAEAVARHFGELKDGEFEEDVCDICLLPETPERDLMQCGTTKAGIEVNGEMHPIVQCGKWFHIDCLTLDSTPIGDWLCRDCFNPRRKLWGLDFEVGLEGFDTCYLPDDDEDDHSSGEPKDNNNDDKGCKEMDDKEGNQKDDTKCNVMDDEESNVQESSKDNIHHNQPGDDEECSYVGSESESGCPKNEHDDEFDPKVDNESEGEDDDFMDDEYEDEQEEVTKPSGKRRRVDDINDDGGEAEAKAKSSKWKVRAAQARPKTAKQQSDNKVKVKLDSCEANMLRLMSQSTPLTRADEYEGGDKRMEKNQDTWPHVVYMIACMTDQAPNGPGSTPTEFLERPELRFWVGPSKHNRKWVEQQFLDGNYILKGRTDFNKFCNDFCSKASLKMSADYKEKKQKQD